MPLQAFVHDAPSPRKASPHPQVLLLKSYPLLHGILKGYRSHNASLQPTCVNPKRQTPGLGSSSYVPAHQLGPLWQGMALLYPSLPSPATQPVHKPLSAISEPQSKNSSGIL